MRIRQIAATGVAGIASAALLVLGAGAANAAPAETCPGTGPAASLSAADHEAFSKEMTALKAQRDAIMKKYAKSAPAAGRGQGQRARGGARRTGSQRTASQRAAMQAELATWRASRDALFAKYGISARARGRAA